MSFPDECDCEMNTEMTLEISSTTIDISVKRNVMNLLVSKMINDTLPFQ
jgi:hypothetical protein